MRAYLRVLSALAARSYLLTLVVLMLALLPVMGLVSQWSLSSIPAGGIGLVIAVFCSPMTGMLLGNGLVSFLEGHAAQVVPGYGRRVGWVLAVVGLLAWLPVPLVYSWVQVHPLPVPWLRWAPLWAYGALGLGFLLGAWMPGMGLYRGGEFWKRQILMTLFFGVIAVSVGHEDLRTWWISPWLPALPGYNPLAALCLLLGPLSWPVLLARKLAPRPQAGDYAIAVLPSSSQQQIHVQRGGTALDAWLLSSLMARRHSGARRWPDLLVFSPALLSVWTGAVFVAVWPLLWAFMPVLGGGRPMTWTEVGSSSSPAFMLLTLVLLPMMASVVEVPRLGRVLMLPGLSGRNTLPHWIFRRLLTQWALGSSVLLLPAALWALWLGMAPVMLALYALLACWMVCTAATLVYWRAPGRRPSRNLDVVNLAVWGLSIPLVPLFRWLVLDQYSAVVCAAILGLLFIVPMVLHAWAVRRWQRMEYGA